MSDTPPHNDFLPILFYFTHFRFEASTQVNRSLPFKPNTFSVHVFEQIPRQQYPS